MIGDVDVMGQHSVDYLENCEGASLPVIHSVINTLESLCQFLLIHFTKCVDNLQWRVGTSILWFIMTATSPKLPYFHCHLNLATILQNSIWKLNKSYEMANGYSRELLLSPGAFWDLYHKNLLSSLNLNFPPSSS